MPVSTIFELFDKNNNLVDNNSWVTGAAKKTEFRFENFGLANHFSVKFQEPHTNNFFDNMVGFVFLLERYHSYISKK